MPRNQISVIALLVTLALTSPSWAAPPPTGTVQPYQDAGLIPSETVRPAPDFSLPLLGEGPTRLSDYRGKLVLLNFWATWCRPCVKEMPALERLRDRYADRMEVLAVSLDVTDRDSVAAFVSGYGWKLPILTDPLNDVGDLYAVRVMPTSYLIGADGTILARAFGALAWDGPATLALFDSLLPPPHSVLN